MTSIVATVIDSSGVMENDENQPPLDQFNGSVLDKSSLCGSTLLKESNRDNIESRSPAITKVSAQSPLPSSGSQTPSVEDQPPHPLEQTIQNSGDVWKERCTVITRQEHEEYIKFASEIVSDLVDSLPFESIETTTKLDQSNSTVSSSNLAVSDSHSVCSSVDYTPSDSSFDTAREDFQQSLPDLLLPDGLHGNQANRRVDTDRSDTDYESATDFDESSLSILDPFAASSPREGFQSVTLLDKTPVPFCQVPFDREKTPVVANGVLCYPGRNAAVLAEDTRLILSEELEKVKSPVPGEICQVEFEKELKPEIKIPEAVNSPVIEKNLCDLLILDKSNQSLKFEEVANESASLETEDKLIVVEPHSLCSPLPVEEDVVPAQIELESNQQEIAPVASEVNLESQETLIVETEVKPVNEDIDTPVIEVDQDCQDTLVTENTEVISVNEVIEPASTEVESASEVITNTEPEVEPVESSEEKSEEQQVVSEEIPNSDNQSLAEDVLDSHPTEETTKEKEVDDFTLAERLELEASIIAEELINLSLLEKEAVEGDSETNLGEASENMRDTKMADVENNEHGPNASGDGGSMDENVNPFQTRSRLSSSPVKGEKLKNGETPKKAATTPTGDSRKSTPVRRISPGSRGTLTSTSPKRKGSSGESSDTDKNTKTKELVNGVSPAGKDSVSKETDSQVFKKPLPKQHPTLPRPSGNMTPEAELPSNNESGNPLPVSGAMVRSLEDEVITEAGPDVAEFSDSEFRSAADVFKDPAAFDFLQMAGSKHLSESALARMSLYVKFDPLLKAISPVSKKTVTKTPTSECSQMSTTTDSSDDLLMLGTPKECDAQSDESGTPSNKNKTMEARLLDLSPSPMKRQEGETNGAVNLRRVYSEEEFTQALRMQELLFQEQLLKKERELDDRVKIYDKEQTENLKTIQSFQETSAEMRKTVLEYEKTISQLIDDREKEKQMTAENFTQMKKERDQALEDLQSVETAFADLHRRYEKVKSAVEGFKKNEDTLKSYVKEGQLAVKKQEQKYDLLKQHAEETLERANIEIDTLRRSSEAENAALRAQLKKAEMKVEGLEKSLKQKNKENAELTNLCDELIAKVGQANS